MKDLNNPEILKHLPIITIYPDNAQARVKQGVKDGKEWMIREQVAFLNTGKRYPVEFILIIDKDKSPYPSGNYLLSASSFGVGDFNSLRFNSRDLVLIPLDEVKKGVMMQIQGEICSPMRPPEDCQTILLVSDDSQTQQTQIDYSQYAPVWGVAFTSVLFLWLFSHGIGHILKLVKNA